MKRYFIIGMMMLGAIGTGTYANVIDMGGVKASLDTIESYQAGPGTTYTKIQVTKGSKIRTIYVLDVDLNNPNNAIEVRTGQDKIGVSETLPTMHQHWDKPNHRMVGGVNCTPYIMTQHEHDLPQFFDGLATHPAYAVCSQGFPVCSHTQYDRGHGDDTYDSGYLGIDNTKTAHVNDFYFVGALRKGTETYPIHELNRPRKFMGEDRITVYNEKIGTSPKFDCQEVVFTINEWKTNGELACVAVSKNTSGGTKLSAGKGSIQGLNAAKAIVNQLAVGDTFHITLNMVPRDGTPVGQIDELCGGYSVNMINGNLLPRNTNEPYNYNDYPRPMMGTAPGGKRVWLIEMQTPGMSTAEGCYILKSFGATAAAAFDGGGSAQMFVNGEYALHSSDGTGERALPVALWVVATCDDSQDAGKMEFIKPLGSVPGYASYTPTIRAWTKDGLLISHDYQDYTLSCEPATMGTISADGKTFTANPVNESGKLIARHGTCSVETAISVADSEVKIVLDSVVLGNDDYVVEVNAIAGTQMLPLNPKALSWSSSDEAVCTVNEGTLHGEKNETAWITGTLGRFADSIKVNVELATAHQMRNDGNKAIGEWAGKKDTLFQLASTKANLKININEKTYGCPDSILIIINSNAPVASMVLSYQTHDGEEQTFSRTGVVTPGENYTYSFAVDKMADTQNRGIFPILLKEGKFTFKSPKAKTDYMMTVKDIILCFSNWKEASGLWEMHDEQCTMYDGQKIMVGGQLYIIRGGKVYDAKGRVR